jgi:multicomponent Na+:H+ antiporter subunit F
VILIVAPWAVLALTLATAAVLYRVLAGPTIFDRLTGLSVIATNSIILLLLFGMLSGRMDAYVDIALSYALIGLVSALTLAKYFERTEEARR